MILGERDGAFAKLGFETGKFNAQDATGAILLAVRSDSPAATAESARGIQYGSRYWSKRSMLHREDVGVEIS